MYLDKNISVVVPVIYINFHDVVGTKKKPKGHHFIYWIWMKSFVSFERNMKETLKQYSFHVKIWWNYGKYCGLYILKMFYKQLISNYKLVVFIFNLIYLFDRVLCYANQMNQQKEEL